MTWKGFVCGTPPSVDHIIFPSRGWRSREKDWLFSSCYGFSRTVILCTSYMDYFMLPLWYFFKLERRKKVWSNTMTNKLWLFFGENLLHVKPGTNQAGAKPNQAQDSWPLDNLGPFISVDWFFHCVPHCWL